MHTSSILAMPYSILGDQHGAIEVYGEVLRIAHDLVDRRAEALALGDLGLSYRLIEIFTVQ